MRKGGFDVWTQMNCAGSLGIIQMSAVAKFATIITSVLVMMPMTDCLPLNTGASHRMAA